MSGTGRIIDSHCHIYLPSIAPRVIEAVDRFYDGLPQVEHFDGLPRTLIETGRRAGVSHFIVHNVATRPEHVPVINHFIAESVQASGGCFTGLGAMHPDSADLEGDLRQLLDLGLKGVKIHPDFQHFQMDDEKAFPIYELCEKNDLPVLVHTGDYRYDNSNPERALNVLRTFPRLKMIGAHFGGWSVWDRARRLLPGHPNFYVDTSSSFHWLTKEEAADLIRAYGPDRVMYGTDYPMWPQEPEQAFLHALGLTLEEEEQILWRTCAGLFHIDLRQTAEDGQGRT